MALLGGSRAEQNMNVTGGNTKGSPCSCFGGSLHMSSGTQLPALWRLQLQRGWRYHKAPAAELPLSFCTEAVPTAHQVTEPGKERGTALREGQGKQANSGKVQGEHSFQGQDFDESSQGTTRAEARYGSGGKRTRASTGRPERRKGVTPSGCCSSSNCLLTTRFTFVRAAAPDITHQE